MAGNSSRGKRALTVGKDCLSQVRETKTVTGDAVPQMHDTDELQKGLGDSEHDLKCVTVAFSLSFEENKTDADTPHLFCSTKSGDWRHELSTHTAIVRCRGICELQSGISAQPMIRFFIKSSFVGNPLMSGRFLRY